MEYDKDKVDEAAMAMLYLTSFKNSKSDPVSAWKGIDWDTLDRLYEKGFILDPKNKNKSVVFTAQGAKLSEKLFKKHFGVKESNDD